MYKIPAKTLFVGKKLVFVPECHSTNTLALDLSQQSASAPDGTIVITDNQTAGRGQRGNSWNTEPGKNLTFSVLLKPTFLQIQDQFLLNIFTSLAIYDLISNKINATCHIKWPNDVLAGDKKLCGILIENQIRGQQLHISIIGIGLNVNQAEFPNLQATSLLQVLQHESDLSDVLEDLAGCLEARYLQLRQGHAAQLKDDYLSALYWRNENHLFTSGGLSFEGTIRGIDELGKLQVETKEGMRGFEVKEISYIR